MPHTHFHKPHHPSNGVPEELEPGALPVDPDEGMVPALIPDDPEHDRVIDPAASQARLADGDRRQGEVARCP